MKEVANLQGARIRRPPAKLIEQTENAHCFTTDLLAEEIDEPKKIIDAFSGQHAVEWKEAADAEYASLIKNKTWDLVSLPNGKNVVGSKCIF